MVFIHNIENGIPMPTSPEKTQLRAPYIAVNSNNLEAVNKLMSPEFWQTADVLQYSKHANPSIKDYDFNLSLLLEPNEE